MIDTLINAFRAAPHPIAAQALVGDEGRQRSAPPRTLALRPNEPGSFASSARSLSSVRQFTDTQIRDLLASLTTGAGTATGAGLILTNLSFLSVIAFTFWGAYTSLNIAYSSWEIGDGARDAAETARRHRAWLQPLSTERNLPPKIADCVQRECEALASVQASAQRSVQGHYFNRNIAGWMQFVTVCGLNLTALAPLAAATQGMVAGLVANFIGPGLFLAYGIASAIHTTRQALRTTHAVVPTAPVAVGDAAAQRHAMIRFKRDSAYIARFNKSVDRERMFFYAQSFVWVAFTVGLAAATIFASWGLPVFVLTLCIAGSILLTIIFQLVGGKYYAAPVAQTPKLANGHAFATVRQRRKMDRLIETEQEAFNEAHKCMLRGLSRGDDGTLLPWYRRGRAFFYTCLTYISDTWADDCLNSWLQERPDLVYFSLAPRMGALAHAELKSTSSRARALRARLMGVWPAICALPESPAKEVLVALIRARTHDLKQLELLNTHYTELRAAFHHIGAAGRVEGVKTQLNRALNDWMQAQGDGPVDNRRGDPLVLEDVMAYMGTYMRVKRATLAYERRALRWHQSTAAHMQQREPS